MTFRETNTDVNVKVMNFLANRLKSVFLGGDASGSSLVWVRRKERMKA